MTQPPSLDRLFPRPARYLACLVGVVISCIALSGALRHLGAPDRFPLGAARTYVLDADGNPYRALLTQRARDYGDFRPIYEAARGRHLDPEYALYRGHELSEHRAAFVYTPLAALAVLPLARAGLTLQEAADRAHLVHRALWVLGGLLLFGVLTHGRPRRRSVAALFGAHFVLFYPLVKAVQLTQAGLWIWFALVVAAWLSQRRHWALAGIALGLGVSIKPHLVLIPGLLALMGGAPVPLLVAAGATIAVGAIVSVAYAGWADIVTYVTDTLPYLSAGYAYFPNQSVNGLLHRFMGEQDPAVFNLAPKVAWIQAASSSFAAVVLGITWLVGRRQTTAARDASERVGAERYDSEAVLYRYALATTAAVLASPVCWIHHYVLLALPIVVGARLLDRSGTTAMRGALFLALMLLGWFFDSRYLRGFPEVLLSGLEFYGALLLLGCLLAWTAQGVRPRAAA